MAWSWSGTLVGGRYFGNPFDPKERMPNHIRWRLQYRQRRYARMLNQQELDKRVRDVFLNMLQLNGEAKIGLLPVQAQGAIWIEKWTHVLEEMQLRHGPFPNGFTQSALHSDPFPDFVSELAKKGAKVISELNLTPGKHFIKYGRREFMTALHGEGRLRIQPASYFSNPYHNGAIRDDELSVPLSVALNRNDIVNLVTNPQDVPINAPDQRFDINLEYGNDYWLYCLTTSINPRLFVDFGADACVIIHDQSEFRKRLRKAAAAATNESIIREGAAVYLDPLLPPKEIPYVPLTKPFGYSYQQEYRFCWTPFSTQPLTHLDVHLGELEDISELVVLE